MITVTVKAVLDDTLPDCKGHYLYRFYDGEFTFYVGKSWDVEDRIATHLGVGSRPRGNRILDIVNENLPGSLDWKIDLYAVKDCEQVLHEHLDELGWNIEALCNNPNFIEMGIQKAEESMIWKHKPYLNVLNSAEPSALPERYARPGVSSAQFLKV